MSLEPHLKCLLKDIMVARIWFSIQSCMSSCPWRLNHCFNKNSRVYYITIFTVLFSTRIHRVCEIQFCNNLFNFAIMLTFLCLFYVYHLNSLFADVTKLFDLIKVFIKKWNTVQGIFCRLMFVVPLLWDA